MSMSGDKALSLAARSRRCKQAFNMLSVQLRDSQYVDQVSPTAIDDQFGRFWSDHFVLKEPRKVLTTLLVYGRATLVLSRVKSFGVP